MDVMVLRSRTAGSTADIYRIHMAWRVVERGKGDAVSVRQD